MTLSVKEFVERSGASDSTLTQYDRELSRLERWLEKPLGDATVRDLDRLKTQLRKIDSGPQYVRLLRMFYKIAEREDLRRVCVMKQRFKKLAPEDVLTPKDVQALIDATPVGRDKALIGGLWDTGSRIHEIVAVQLRNVSVTKDGHYRIFFSKSKVPGEEHSGYVMDTAPVLRAWLKAHPDQRPDAPLFPTYSGGYLTRHGGYKIVERASRKAGIQKRIYPHLFRHSRATHLLRLGMSEAQVKRLLGWAPGSTMLNRYAHLSDGDAYRGLLKAQGFDVPEADAAESMAFEDTDLKPVVPMVAPPGARPEVTLTGEQQAEMTKLIKDDPNIRRFLTILMIAAGADPRGSLQLREGTADVPALK